MPQMPIFMPKNTEIERKFLVKSDSFKAEATAKKEIIQGYLCKAPGKTIRVRISDEQAFLTIKSSRLREGLAKFEWEKEIDLDAAREMLHICLPGMIEKTRYIIPVRSAFVSKTVRKRYENGTGTVRDGHENDTTIQIPERKWEVDVFHGRKEGLVLAEIELGDENEPFTRPEWLGEEVTGQPQYYNANM